jgi:iron complex outermembrane receptor protein
MIGEKRFFWVSTLFTSAAFGSVSVLAVAQTPDDGSAPRLEEIVVTATKTERSLQDVPISISAYRQERMDQLGVRGIEDISKLTPGVQIEAVRERASGTNISIRGVSSRIGAGTTGIYIDDAPIQVRIIGYDATNVYPLVFDLERVEVLRGPQGTLYGAGSMGGNVRFITPKPNLSGFTTYSRAEVASTEHGGLSYEAGTALNMPLVDGTLGLRVSAWTQHAEGWVDRVDFTTGQTVDEDSNSSDARVFRASLAYAPNESLTITPSVYFQDLEVNDTSSYWSTLSNVGAGSYRNGYPQSQPYDDRFILPNLQVELDLDRVTLFSSTSYFDREAMNEWDYSTVVPAVLSRGAFETLPGYLSIAYFEDTQENFTEELRLSSADPGSRLEWVAGLYYGRMKQRNFQSVDAVHYDFLLDAFGLPPSALPPLADGGKYGPSTLLIRNETVDEQYAAFGEATYNVTDALRATLGLRVARTKLEFENYQAGPFNGPVTGGQASLTATPVTPKLSVSYDFDSKNMIYATAAKGYRIGGGNAMLPRDICREEMDRIGIDAAPTTYDSDTLWSYEIGSKSSLFHDRLQINASAFLIDWNDIQQQVFLRCAFQYVENVGGARSVGFDVQARYQATDNLEIGASVGYVEAKYTSDAYPNDNSELQPIVVKNNSLGIQPWNFVFTADYERPYSDRLSLYANATVTHRSRDHGKTAFLEPRSVSYDPWRVNAEDSTLVNVRVGFRLGGLDVSAFANNLLNDDALTSRNHDHLNSRLFKETRLRPRTIGLSAIHRY